jgi:glycosyltransferase involved in cell wall biosynthesis
VLVTSLSIPHTGGASSHFELLDRELQRRGLLAGKVTGSMASAWVGTRAAAALCRRAGWEWPRAALLRRTIRRLARLVAAARPAGEALFHSHDAVASCAVLEVLRSGDVLVQTVHGPGSRELVDAGYRSGGTMDRAWNALERRAFGGVNLLLSVDGGQAVILRDEFHLSDDRIRVVRNAVDVDELESLSNGEAPMAGQNDVFVVPRRLVRKNGVEFAIRALAYESAATFRVVVAGDGPELRRLKEIARSSGVATRVRFLGSIGHATLLPLMKAACGVIVPSVPFGGVVEATSLAVLEAMAVGVPVIASDIGGIAEILSSRNLGCLVRPGQPEAIARAMRAVHDLGERARAVRIDRAREHVRREFGVSGWMTKILGAYETAKPGDGREAAPGGLMRDRSDQRFEGEIPRGRREAFFGRRSARRTR